MDITNTATATATAGITVTRPSPQHRSHRPHDATDIVNTSTPLAPSPTFNERRKRRDVTNPDGTIASPTTPSTPRPRRPDLLTRGLSLRLPEPEPDFVQSGGPAFAAAPLSPKLQTYDTYMQPNITQHSPATSLPRHSRGLDFSRACTTLHHSTLADKNSPDSSPIITQKSLAIPGRKLSMSSMALDSPGMNVPNNLVWGASTPGPDRSAVSSSLGSVNMMGSDSESSNSDDDASMGADDNDDPMLATPQVHKLHNPQANTPFNPSTPSNMLWGNGSHFSPAQTSLMKTIRRTRIHKNPGRRSRKSSSSASNSGYSSMASPRTTSPPPLRSIETASGGGGYFTWANAARTRRESLALGTEGMNLSSGNDSGDEASQTTPSTPGVVRRAVTRRGNLLPKTKGFARIRAALAEEATPVDTDVRREAETIRQVRERDGHVPDLEASSERPAQTPTAASSPNLLPAVPESAQEDFGKDLDSDSSGNKGLGMSFAAHASRNGGGLNYWNRFDFSKRTPPPPPFGRQGSVMSDNYIDSPTSDMMAWRRPRARSSASDASEALQSGAAATAMPAGVNDDVHLQKFKRRREDDYDIATIKRRAVSPGMSSQNSPVLTNSPSQREGSYGWGQPPDRKDRKELQSNGSDTSMSGMFGQQQQQQQQQSARSSSASSIGVTAGNSGNLVNQGKKLGLQPMADTNDGLMKMTIE